MTKELDFAKLMQFLLFYSLIGRAAYIGMIISAICLALSIFITIPFNPLIGFILVPIAGIGAGLQEIFKRKKN